MIIIDNTRIINSHTSFRTAIHQLPIFPEWWFCGPQVINRYIRCRSSHAWSLRKNMGVAWCSRKLVRKYEPRTYHNISNMSDLFGGRWSVVSPMFHICFTVFPGLDEIVSGVDGSEEVSGCFSSCSSIQRCKESKPPPVYIKVTHSLIFNCLREVLVCM